LQVWAGFEDTEEEMIQKRYRLPAAVLVVLGAVMLIAAACGSSGASTPTASGTGGGGATATVVIRNFAFTPQTITVKVGDTVTWTNNDSAPHTVTSATSIDTSATTTSAFDSGQFGQGQTFSFAFTKAGTYFYECSIHAKQPAMHGEVIVQ
jgi:plastocyanin